jgi:predicted acylesterase/phospholipase RssA
LAIDPTTELAIARDVVRAKAAPAPALGGRRVAVVLSGGGARGSYEAGVLLAFQDAQLPTHILTATSIGSINAGSYAAHSSSVVGNAESLVRSWADVTPEAVGIDWSRYLFMLGGLVAIFAGIGNLIREWFVERNLYVHLHYPLVTWLVLTFAGIAVLFFYDDLPYIGYVTLNLFRKRSWRPDRSKLALSLLGNIVVWGFLSLFLAFSHLHVGGKDILELSPLTKTMVAALIVLVIILMLVMRERFNWISHAFLRLPLRSGLFPNFERARFLRSRIPADGLRHSPIRVLMTAADVQNGRAVFFTNTSQFDLASDPNVDHGFIQTEVRECDDVLAAVLASSAYPIAYETMELEGERYTDGGIVANQPIRPAIRMGADIIFLVLVEPRAEHGATVRTFLDVGVRAIDILMAQNLKADLEVLANINQLCETYARRKRVKPEQVIVDLGTRRYRYLKAFTIAPEHPLQATVLDFDGSITAPAILLGYRDGCAAVEQLRNYLRQLPPSPEKIVLKLQAEAGAGK